MPFIKKFFIFIILTEIIYSCSRFTEQPESVNYIFIDTWGKDYRGSAGPGHGDGTSGSNPGAFNLPVKILYFQDKFLVLDSGNFRIQRFTLEGYPDSFEDQISCFGNYFGEEGITDGKFLSCSDMAIDNLGRIFISDRKNMRVQVFSSSGTFITNLAFFKNGQIYSTNIPGSYFQAECLAVDNLNRLYVLDLFYKSIDRYSSDLKIDTSWGNNGRIQDSSFDKVCAMACYNEELFLLEKNRITVFSTLSGQKIKTVDLFGYNYDRLSNASDLWISDDEIFITDGCYIKIFKDDFSFKGFFGAAGSKKGELLYPSGICKKNNRLYICDTQNHRIQVFEKNE